MTETMLFYTYVPSACVALLTNTVPTDELCCPHVVWMDRNMASSSSIAGAIKEVERGLARRTSQCTLNCAMIFRG